MIMTCTIEKVLADARMLVNRLRDHDGSADNLIAQAQTLHKRVDAMKQYQEDLNELNEVARHRPRSSLIMNLLQENTQIRELQQENKELRMSLEEHQSALELIMSKYREQIFKLVLANRLDKQEKTPEQSPPEDVRDKIDKVCEMAAVMQKSIHVDDEAVAKEQQMLTQLKVENRTLREILHIAVANSSNMYQQDTKDEEAQTEGMEEEDQDLDSSVITVKEMDISSKDTVMQSSSNSKIGETEEEKGDKSKDSSEIDTQKDSPPKIDQLESVEIKKDTPKKSEKKIFGKKVK